ncbi:unnamed protein product [Bursaphelenchus xylophilus]|uniref:RNA-directed DNA polymerase n=1 Tax=Bursaphelenchus xylophilus TaxID=6326 RepID=A0A7I8WG99_BURXY|nr:unnamed protein product [Bursaphelenchus xylophilus]CAG9111272.1 unnamed protein product [Bursaphelenchus xylophilus]
MAGGDKKPGEDVATKLKSFIEETRASAEAAEQRQASIDSSLNRLVELLTKTAALQAIAPSPSPQPPAENAEDNRQKVDFAELMFLDMRLPTLNGREKSSEVSSFLYKFKTGTRNMSSAEKRDLLEAKLSDQALRIYEHCKRSATSENFEEIFENFEKELKGRSADNRDWASIFLKPYYRRHDMSMRDYADKISDITMRAFVGAPKEIMERQLITKFMSGLNHREVGNALAAERHKNLPFEDMVKIAINVLDHNQGNRYRPQTQQRSFGANNNNNNSLAATTGHQNTNQNTNASVPAQQNRPNPPFTGGNRSPLEPGNYNNSSRNARTPCNYCKRGTHREEDCYKKKNDLQRQIIRPSSNPAPPDNRPSQRAVTISEITSFEPSEMPSPDVDPQLILGTDMLINHLRETEPLPWQEEKILGTKRLQGTELSVNGVEMFALIDSGNMAEFLDEEEAMLLGEEQNHQNDPDQPELNERPNVPNQPPANQVEQQGGHVNQNLSTFADAVPDYEAALKDPKRRLVLITDASSFGFGAALHQPDENGYLRPIAFVSRRCTPTESRLHSSEVEAVGMLFACLKLEYILFGIPTLVLTDNKGIIPLLKKGSTNPRIDAMFAILAQKFDLEVKYIKGTANYVADTLSRAFEELRGPKISENDQENPENEADPQENTENAENLEDCEESFHIKSMSATQAPVDITEIDNNNLQRPWIEPENWTKEIMHDAEIRVIYMYLVDGKLPPDPRESEKLRELASTYTLKDNVLYKLVENTLRLVIPASLIDELLTKLHATPLTCHPGRKKLVPLLSGYYFSKMTSRIDRFIARCLVCNKTKSARNNQQPSGNFDSSEPFEIVHIDVLKLGLSANGFVYVLTMVDDFSRYLIAAPMKSKSSEEVAKTLLSNLFLRFGAPKTLHCDKGTEFLNQTLDTLRILTKTAISTTPGHMPSANGVAERANKDILDKLRKIASSGDDWDDHLPFVTFAHNSLIHSTTNCTPHSVIYGSEPRFPAEWSEKWTPPNPLYRMDAMTYKDWIGMKIRETIAEIGPYLKEKRKERAEIQQRQAGVDIDKYKVGDLVFVDEDHFPSEPANRKIEKFRFGPYKIIQITDTSALLAPSEERTLFSETGFYPSMKCEGPNHENCTQILCASLTTLLESRNPNMVVNNAVSLAQLFHILSMDRPQAFKLELAVRLLERHRPPPQKDLTTAEIRVALSTILAKCRVAAAQVSQQPLNAVGTTCREHQLSADWSKEYEVIRAELAHLTPLKRKFVLIGDEAIKTLYERVVFAERSQCQMILIRNFGTLRTEIGQWIALNNVEKIVLFFDGILGKETDAQDLTSNCRAIIDGLRRCCTNEETEIIFLPPPATTSNLPRYRQLLTSGIFTATRDDRSLCEALRLGSSHHPDRVSENGKLLKAGATEMAPILSEVGILPKVVSNTPQNEQRAVRGRSNHVRGQANRYQPYQRGRGQNRR